MIAFEYQKHYQNIILKNTLNFFGGYKTTLYFYNCKNYTYCLRLDKITDFSMIVARFVALRLKTPCLLNCKNYTRVI